MHLPISGSPTPIPEFLNAQAIPTYSLLSYTSFTANKVSFKAVPGSAIWPFGNSCPASIAFLHLNSQFYIPTNSANGFILHSVAKADCVTPKPLNAPPGGLLVYTAIPSTSEF